MNHMIMQAERIAQANSVRKGNIYPRYGVFKVCRNETTTKSNIKFAVCDLSEKRELEVFENEQEADMRCNLLNIGARLEPLVR